MNSIKLQKRMDTIFMISRNSKTSDPHGLILNHPDKVYLNSDKCYFIKSYHLLYMKNYKKAIPK